MHSDAKRGMIIGMTDCYNDFDLDDEDEEYDDDYDDCARLARGRRAAERMMDREMADTSGKAAADDAVAPADPGEFNVTFEDVYGYDAVKKVLFKLTDMAKDTEKYARLGARMPHGVIMYGKPGVGKTMMAKALIRELGRPTYIIRKTEGGNAFITTIGKVFAKAKEAAPSVILLDDLDRYSSGRGYTPEFAAVQAGIDSVQRDDVLVIATVNEMGRLPEALLRNGRFDRKLGMDVPGTEDSAEIIARFLKGKRVGTDIDTRTVARLLDGYTCAALDSVLNDATLNAGYAGRDAISMEDLVAAILADIYDVNDIEEIPMDEKADIAYHEAGHAAAAILVHPGSVSLASVRGTGRGGTRGFVRTLRNQESTYEDLRHEIMETLAGRAALELKFSTKDIGCSSDIEKAVRIARSLVGDCCVSGFKFVLFSPRQDSSEGIFNTNNECIRLIEDCYDEAKALLSRSWDLVEAIAKGLIEKDTLICTDLDEIVEDCVRPELIRGTSAHSRRAA